MDEVEIDDDHPHLGALQFVSKLSPNGALPAGNRAGDDDHHAVILTDGSPPRLEQAKLSPGDH
jgi:hypothetical protein